MIGALNNDLYGVRDLQLQELEILLSYKHFCEAHDLTYYLNGGTLLGAVRHQGFIPWDDDIDVAMPRPDYDRFVQLTLSCGIDDLYELHTYHNNPDYPLYFAKLKPRISSSEDNLPQRVPYVDIFPLDTCPDNKTLALLFFKAILLVNVSLSARIDPNFVCGYSKKSCEFSGI